MISVAKPTLLPWRLTAVSVPMRHALFERVRRKAPQSQHNLRANLPCKHSESMQVLLRICCPRHGDRVLIESLKQLVAAAPTEASGLKEVALLIFSPDSPPTRRVVCQQHTLD